MAATLEERRRQTVKRTRVRIRDKLEIEGNPRTVQAKVKWAAVTEVETVLLLAPVIAAAIEAAIEADHPARVARALPSVVVRAAGAEVPQRPAVHAVPPVWVLAAAVVAEVGVAEVGAAAVGDGGRKIMTKENTMISKKWAPPILSSRTALRFSLSFFLALLISCVSFAQQKPAASTTSAQETFATAKDAADALIQAAGSYDLTAMRKILGPDGEDLVASEDSVQDKNIAIAFAEEAKRKNSIAIDPKKPGRAILIVGDRDWPMAIPIVKRNGAWVFDTKAGRQEALYRRIGANELDALQACRNYVEAQHEYAWTRHDGSDLNQYAQQIISSPGKQNGLVWRNADGNLDGPIAAGVAEALAEGYSDKAKPYHGYYFKILKGQGPAAPLGKLDFVVEGAMIGGFALAAAPAEYRVTGVKTFIVSYEGIVYQKDLGPDTLKIFKEMELYNPDKTWRSTNDSWPPDALETSAGAAQD
jgi:hypothetical protein